MTELGESLGESVEGDPEKDGRAEPERPPIGVEESEERADHEKQNRSDDPCDDGIAAPQDDALEALRLRETVPLPATERFAVLGLDC